MSDTTVNSDRVRLGDVDLDRLYRESREDLDEAKRELAAAQQRVRMAERALSAIQDIRMMRARSEDADRSEVSPRDQFIETVAIVIAEHGGEMRLSALREELYTRGIALPGKGTDANLLARLRRSHGRVQHVRRGVYAVTTPDSAGFSDSAESTCS